MVFEETLENIRAAFESISAHDLEGWGLDPMGWNYNGRQETDDTDLHLLRSERERASITILPEFEATGESLQRQILSKMKERGLISN